MNAFIFLVAAQSDSQVAQIARTFGVDWPHLAAQTISFGIVCALLYKFAYQRVLTMLEERRQQIALGIANAEKIKAELDRIEAERQEVMAQAYAHAAKALDILAKEMTTTMGLCGVNTIAEIDERVLAN